MKLTSLLSLLATALLLNGCASLLPKGKAPDRLYTLNAPRIEQQPGVKIAQNLQVLIPEANPGIDTERIALRRENNRINYYAQARWAAVLPELVQSIAVESFDSSSRLKSVGSDLIPMKDSFQLLLEIRDFQVEYAAGDQAPRANVRITAKLIRSQNNDIIATRTYHKIQPAQTNTLGAVVAAMDAANQDILQQIMRDVLSTLNRPPG